MQVASTTSSEEMLCDGLDDDGDGMFDEGCDDEADGYCDAGMDGAFGCPLGGGDCDDGNRFIHPAAVEICDGRDNDCDGRVDVGCPTTITYPAWADDNRLLDFDETALPMSHAQLVWTGEQLAACWTHNHDYFVDGDVYFGIYDRFGNVLSGPTLIGPGGDGCSLLWQGVEYGVAWQGGPVGGPGRQVLFVRMDVNGEPFGPVEQVGVSVDARRPSLAWSGHEYAVSWTDAAGVDQDVWFSHRSWHGTWASKLNETAYAPPRRAGTSRLVWGGSAFGLAWIEDPGSEMPAHLRFNILDRAGGKLHPSDADLASDPADAPFGALEMVRTDDGFGIAINSRKDADWLNLYLLRVDSDGHLVPIPDPEGDDASDDLRRVTRTGEDGEEAQSFALAWTGAHFAVAWQVPGDWYPDILYAGVDADEALTRRPIPGSSSDKQGLGSGHEPALAWMGFELGAVYAIRGADASAISYIRVAPCPDADRDGYNVCAGNPLGGDCNDDDPAVWPGATELPNGADDDCDGTIDEDFDRTFDAPLRVWSSDIGDASGRPRIARTGTSYAVVWPDGDGRVRLARLDAIGALLDDPPLVLSDAGRGGVDPDLAWTGTRLGVIWRDVPPSPELSRGLVLQVYDADLDLVAATTFAPDGYAPSIDWAVDRFTTVYVSDDGSAGMTVRLVRHTASAAPIGQRDVIAPGEQPAIAWNGRWLGIAFSAPAGSPTCGDGNPNGCAALARRARDLELDEHEPVRLNSWDDPCDLPAVSGSATGFGVAFHDVRWGKNWVFFRAMGDDLSPLALDGQVGAEQATVSRVAWTGAEFGVAADWTLGSPPQPTDIQLDRVAEFGGRIEAPTNVSLTPSISSIDPDLAWGWQEYGIAWLEWNASDATWRLQVARLLSGSYCRDDDADGFDPCPADPVSNPDGGDCNDDAAGIHPWAFEMRNGVDDDCDGSIDEGYDTAVPYAAKDLDLPLGTGFAVDDWVSQQSRSAIAWTGSRYAVTWDDPEDWVWLALVEADGTPVTTIPLTPSGRGRAPVVAWSGSRLGVVWRDLDTPGALRLATYDQDGTLLDDVAMNVRSTGRPRVVWAVDRFVIAWTLAGTTAAENQVVLTRRDRHGAAIGGDEVAGFGNDPALAWNGTRLGIAYSDAADGLVLAERSREAGQAHDAPILVPPPSHVGEATLHAIAPRQAGGADGFLVCYTRIAEIFCAPFDGAPLRPAGPVRLAGDMWSLLPRVAWTGSEFGGVYEHHAAEDAKAEIVWQRLDRLGDSQAGIPGFLAVNVSESPSQPSRLADVVWTGSGFGVTWLEYTEGTPPHWIVRLARIASSCSDADGDVHNGCPYHVLGNAMGGDCDDSDPGTYRVPVEVVGVMVDRGEGTNILWVSQDEWAGPATHYDLVTGSLSTLRTDRSYAGATCLASAWEDTPYPDYGVTPPPGEGAYDLVRAVNDCGTGTYGDALAVPDPRDELDLAGPCP